MSHPALSMKIVLPVLVLLISAGMGSAIMLYRPQVAAPPLESNIPQVQIIRAEQQTLKLNIMSQGVVMPREEMDLVTEVSGKVTQVHPQLVAGGFFAANTLLLTVDTRDYDYAIVVAEAQVAEAKRVLIAEQAQVEQALSEWQALGDGEAGQLALRKPQLAEAEAKLQAAKAELAKAKLNRSRCELRAPFAGRVLVKQAGIGQFLPVGAVVARVYANDIAEIRLPISTQQLAFLNLPPDLSNTAAKQWPKVSLTAELGEQLHHWEGRVVRSEAAVSEDSGQIYLVAEIKNPWQPQAKHPPLLKGLFLQAEIDGVEKSNVYRLPRAAVSPLLTVKLVDAEQRLVIRPVEVLRSEKDSVVIKSGLNPGEQVVISDLPIAIAGMQVKVMDD